MLVFCFVCFVLIDVALVVVSLHSDRIVTHRHTHKCTKQWLP